MTINKKKEEALDALRGVKEPQQHEDPKKAIYAKLVKKYENRYVLLAKRNGVSVQPPGSRRLALQRAFTEKHDA